MAHLWCRIHDRGIVVESVLNRQQFLRVLHVMSSNGYPSKMQTSKSSAFLIRGFFRIKKDKLCHIIDKAAVLQPQKTKNRLIDFDLLSEPLQIYLWCCRSLGWFLACTGLACCSKQIWIQPRENEKNMRNEKQTLMIRFAYFEWRSIIMLLWNRIL